MRKSLNVIAIETSQQHCSLSVLVNDQCHSEVNSIARSHSDHLLPMLDSLLKAADVNLSDINLLAYSSGPGSFTGLRMGAAFLQALAYAHDVNTVSVSSLELMAMAGLKAHPSAAHFVCCIDARVNGVYWAVFSRDPSSDSGVRYRHRDALCSTPFDEIGDIDLLDDTVFLGDGVDVVFSATGRTNPENSVFDTAVIPCSDDLVYVARERAETAQAGHDISPVYLRGADAWQKIQTNVE